MTRKNWFVCALVGAALGFTLSLPDASPAQEKNAKIKLSMAKTFFTDLPKVMIDIATDPFGKLLKETTGLDGELSYEHDALATAALLDAGRIQFGVFHGHEFAWVQKKYPKIQTLLVVANKQHNVQAFVIVQKDSPVKEWTDLRGKTIDFPSQTKEHCRIFVGKHCADNAQQTFFKRCCKSESPFIALDDLCKGSADAVVVDSIMLAFYKDIKGPTFSKNLRVFQESKAFPAAVIAYKPGVLSDATVKQFNDGLLKAHNNPVGKDLMQMWSIDGFETPLASYQQMLADALKEYPSP